MDRGSRPVGHARADFGATTQILLDRSLRGNLLLLIGAGECFGEIALVSDRPRTATARCATRVDVLAVDRDAFNALFGTLPPLRGFFQQLIAERLGAAEPEGIQAAR